MSFASIQYVIFLPIVFLLYWGVQEKFRWSILLVASFVFYMSWSVKYAFLIIIIILISYFSAIILNTVTTGTYKKFILSCSIFLSFSLLFIFKYFDFLIKQVNHFFIFAGVNNQFDLINLILPVGISFYTFQSVGYIIDVYRGSKPELHFGKYATFVSFFPQLVAGPIERSHNLLYQIHKNHFFDYNEAVYGCRQILWGFFKKIVIADTLAIYVDMVFNNVTGYTGFSYMLVALFFTFQIYCDFSGYSDIAIGTAHLFNISLMKNFHSPYLSSSVREFWSRWHISLSTWFRDYLYIPLGGNRRGAFRKDINTMLTFLTSGLWHGADWTFVLWGGGHGIAQVVENHIDFKKNNWLIKQIKIICVFCFCVFGWILFRVHNFSDYLIIITGIFDGIMHPYIYIKSGLTALTINKSKLIIISFLIFILFIVDLFNSNNDIYKYISIIPSFIRYILYYLLSFAIIYCWITNISDENFVYFQF